LDAIGGSADGRHWPNVAEPRADDSKHFGAEFATDSLKLGPGDAEGAVQAADRVRFAQRVMHALQAAETRGAPVRLRLHPPELGSLRLEVAITDGALSARLEVETSAARALLLESLPQLRERLATQEIKIERFEVDLMNQRAGDGSQRARDESSASDAGYGFRRTNRDGLGSPADSVAPVIGAHYSDFDGINVLV
jgi:hypothetical protein